MRRVRWSLRTMLVLAAFAAAAFGDQGYVDRQVQRAVDAMNLMCAKGMDARFPGVGGRHSAFPRSGAALPA